MNDSIVPATILHVRVHKTQEPVGQVPNILRDTDGKPIFDTGYSVITCPSLSSGLTVTVKAQ